LLDASVLGQVLYLRIDKALAFEDCDAVIRKESSGHLLLEKVNQLIAGQRVEDIAKVLSYYRHEYEVIGGNSSPQYSLSQSIQQHSSSRRKPVPSHGSSKRKHRRKPSSP
jgi:hypothetical protein